jgi:hypothetical protein
MALVCGAPGVDEEFTVEDKDERAEYVLSIREKRREELSACGYPFNSPVLQAKYATSGECEPHFYDLDEATAKWAGVEWEQKAYRHFKDGQKEEDGRLYQTAHHS